MVVLPPQLRVFVVLVALGVWPHRDDERGASAVEYGLLVAGIAAVIVAAVFVFGARNLRPPVPGHLRLHQPEHGRLHHRLAQ